MIRPFPVIPVFLQGVPLWPQGQESVDFFRLRYADGYKWKTPSSVARCPEDGHPQERALVPERQVSDISTIQILKVSPPSFAIY